MPRGMLNPRAKDLVAWALDVPVEEAQEMIAYAARALRIPELTLRRRILDRKIGPRMVRRLAEIAGWQRRKEERP